MADGESNGHVTKDVTWPHDPNRLRRNISTTAGDPIQQQ